MQESLLAGGKKKYNKNLKGVIPIIYLCELEELEVSRISLKQENIILDY